MHERVSIRNIPLIISTLAEHVQTNKGIQFLVGKTRLALAEQICMQYADNEKTLRVLKIDPVLEKYIISRKAAGEVKSDDIILFRRRVWLSWDKAVSKTVKAVKNKGWYPVILCPEEIRVFIKRYGTGQTTAVLSESEIAGGFTTEVIGEIKLENEIYTRYAYYFQSGTP